MYRKIYRNIYLVCFVILFGLAGCTHILNSLSGMDPDGDGDAKGATHFTLKRPATGHRVFIYDPKAHSWAVYDKDGQRKNTGRATGGKLFCPDVKRPCRTITGKFRILRKGDDGCTSLIYPIDTNGGAPMPYCMYFSPRGHAIHGTTYVPDKFNSHGCIGVTVTAAKWLHNFLRVGSTVIVRPY